MSGGPSGLQASDTIEDAFRRADSLAHPQGKWYSGVMTHDKDARRIVLLVWEIRKLQEQLKDRDEMERLTAELDRCKLALEWSIRESGGGEIYMREGVNKILVAEAVRP